MGLAVPVDSFDPRKGWTEIATTALDGEIVESPKSLDMKDGGYVAFAFKDDARGAFKFYVEWPELEMEEDTGEGVVVPGSRHKTSD